MCGIVGIYLKNKKHQKDLGKLLTGMMNNMASRGPDSAGFAIYDKSNKYKYSASIKTYLFTLGRNKIVNIIQKKITHQRKTDEIVIQEESRTTVSPEATQRQNEQAAVIKVLMSQLCENCRNVLTLFYFHEQSMKEIAEKMNYKNANVSKTKKRECFKKLMKLAKEKYSKTDFF